MDRDILISVARTSLRTKVGKDLADHLTEVRLDVLLKIIAGFIKTESLYSRSSLFIVTIPYHTISYHMAWLSSRNFFRGTKSIVMQISFVMLIFYCFRTKFRGRRASLPIPYHTIHRKVHWFNGSRLLSSSFQPLGINSSNQIISWSENHPQLRT